MARRQRRINEAKHEHWRQVCCDGGKRAAGVGRPSFCDRHRIVESQFWWWRWRLGESIEMAPVESEPAFVPIRYCRSGGADQRAH